MNLIEIRDNAETIDRYTAIFDNPDADGCYIGLHMSEMPFHPQGIGAHQELVDGPGDYLGTEIALSSLPEDCQRAIIQEFEANVYLNLDEIGGNSNFAKALIKQFRAVKGLPSKEETTAFCQSWSHHDLTDAETKRVIEIMRLLYPSTPLPTK